jgi:hypothetical protein
MTVRLYRWDDTSAPVLTGQAGSLTTLLDAVLVNGYGSKTAAGWSINQTTTNKRGYKQGAGGNHPTGVCLYIDDTGPGGGGAREARCCGFDSMSAITPVGVDQFPNGSQTSIAGGYLCIRKSETNDSVARRWYIVADAWTVYIFIEWGNAGNIAMAPGTAFIFGDFKSYKSGDAYAQIIIGRTAENNASGSLENFSQTAAGNQDYTVNSNMPGHFVNRHWNQLAKSQRCGKMFDGKNAGINGMWSGNDQNSADGHEGFIGPASSERQRFFFPYPNPVDGSLWMAPMYINQLGLRGYLKGLWVPQHYLPLNPGDTFTAASGNLSGKSFVAVNSCMRWADSNWLVPTQVFLEFSDTWP